MVAEIENVDIASPAVKEWYHQRQVLAAALGVVSGPGFLEIYPLKPMPHNMLKKYLRDGVAALDRWILGELLKEKGIS